MESVSVRNSVINYRIRLLLSYDGSPYCGWQSQLQHKNKNSVQAILEKVLEKIYKEPITCVAAGRTDAGAHAMKQNIHFNLSKDPRKIPLLLALRTLLPPNIVVQQAWIVPLTFSAISSAKAKTYRYHIVNSDFPSALNWQQTYWYPHHLNIEKLNLFAQEILGRHNFKSFQSSSGRPPKSSFRRIYRAQWFNPSKNNYYFEITGNGFLTQMVRNLVGCQLDLLKKNANIEEFRKILLSENRRLVGRPAPASGLFLYKVHYPKQALSQCEDFGQ